MGKLEITITEETNQSQVESFVRALEAYSGKTAKPATEEKQTEKPDAKQEETTKTKPKKTKKSKKAEAPKTEEAEKPAEESKPEPDTKPESDDKKPSVTIEKIRGLQKDVVKEHKDAIVQKLRNELGAKNLSTLDPKHFDEYYAFLKDLDKNGK